MEFSNIKINRLVLLRDGEKIDREEVVKLARNVSRFGILVPLTVKRIANTDKFEVISGGKRLYAAKIAKLTTVPSLIVDTPSDISRVMLKRGSNQDKFDESEAIKRVIIANELSIEDFAELTGYGVRQVLLMLRLTKLSEFEREVVRMNRLDYETVAEIAVIDDICKRTELLGEAIKLRMTPYEARRLCESERRVKRSPKYINSSVLKDIRIFDNTVNRAIDMLKRAGVEAVLESASNNGVTEYKIKIES